MDISNINSKLYILLLLFSFSCTKKERNTKIPLYHFNENIKFIGYNNEDFDNSKVIFIKKKKKITGKINYTKQNDTVYFGRIEFESIYDTIDKTDTIKIFINKEVHNFSKIKQIFIKKHGIRPAFIEFFLDHKKYREDEVVLHKQ